MFPFEWLLIKNIIHLDKIKLDKDTKRELAATFKNWFEIEKSYR